MHIIFFSFFQDPVLTSNIMSLFKYKVILYTITNKLNMKVLALHVNWVEVLHFGFLALFFFSQGFEKHVISFTN